MHDKLQARSLRTRLDMVILALGLFAIAVALVGSHDYLKPVLESHRTAFMLLVGLLVMLAVIYVRRIMATIVINPLQSLSNQLKTSTLSDLNPESAELNDSNTGNDESWELQELYGVLHDLAVTDALTGLANRYQFERQLKHYVENAKLHGTESVLFYLDLDQFKVVNETCGHLGGDELLRVVAELIQGNVRHADMTARLGGDEFAIVMEQCPLTKGVEIANKLLASFNEYKFVWEQERFNISASIGIILITDDDRDLETVFGCVESACYAAKEAGGNRIQIFQEQDDVLARRQGEIQWAARINKAIELNKLELLYQPVVPIVPKRDAKLGCELLLRMADDNGDPISPGVFMPAAERYGLMPALDRWVIRTVFKWLADNPDALHHFDVFFVNISSQALGDENFLGYVKTQLTQHAVAHRRICFEVTETLAITDVARIMEFAGKIRDLGFRIALDHFGTGVSSFYYLKTLPVDFLKIDGTFIKAMINDPIDHAIVASILAVGKAMGIETIAEHVENQHTLNALQKIGVDYAQGYGILPPHRLSELGKKLSGHDSLVIEPEKFSNI